MCWLFSIVNKPIPLIQFLKRKDLGPHQAFGKNKFFPKKCILENV